MKIIVGQNRNKVNIALPENLINNVKFSRVTTDPRANLALAEANLAYAEANLALTIANTANITSVLAYSEANTALNIAELAYNEANAAFGASAANAYTQANNAYNTANLAYAHSNIAVINISAANVQNVLIGGNTTNVTIDTLITGGGGNTFNIITANTVYSNIYSIGTTAIFTALSGSITLNGASYLIDSFPANQYNTTKYLAQITAPGYGGGSLQATELICMQDGTNTYMTEYATLLNFGSLGYFSSIVTGSTFELIFNTYNLSSASAYYDITRQAVTK
jgi:hypothetical protein